MSCIVMHMFALYLLFLPPLLFVRHRDRRRPQDCYSVDDPSFAIELPGKQNPLDHSYIAYSFSLLLALEFAAAIVLSYSDA